MPLRKRTKRKPQKIRRKEDVRTLRHGIANLRKKIENEDWVRGQTNEGVRTLYKDIGKNREQIRQILDSASDAFVEMDQQGLIVDWNRRAQVVFGWSRDEVLGRPLAATIIPASYRAKFDDGFKSFLSTGESELLNRRMEVTALHRDTHEFPAEISAWATRIGGTYRFHAFVLDISERKRLERLKNEFIGTVSHELRTPITIIREGVSQVVDGILGDVTSEQRDFLSVSLLGIDRLTRIINDLLDISRIEAGRLHLKKELVDIVALAREALSMFDVPIKEKGLTLTYRFPEHPVEIYLDRDKIIQVFTNLTGNALKFTEAGEVEISIAMMEKGITCSVADTGKGIGPKDLPFVFGKFEQFGREAGTGERGTGLGLAISKGIIERHQGKISVSSKPDVGTKFTFTLPRFTAREVFRDYVTAGTGGPAKQGSPLSVIVFHVVHDGRLEKRAKEQRVKALTRHLEKKVNKGLRRKGDRALADAPHILVVLPETRKNDALLAAGRLQQILDQHLEEEALKKEIKIECQVASFPEDASSLDALIENVFQ